MVWVFFLYITDFLKIIVKYTVFLKKWWRLSPYPHLLAEYFCLQGYMKDCQSLSHMVFGGRKQFLKRWYKCHDTIDPLRGILKS